MDAIQEKWFKRRLAQAVSLVSVMVCINLAGPMITLCFMAWWALAIRENT